MSIESYHFLTSLIYFLVKVWTNCAHLTAKLIELPISAENQAYDIEDFFSTSRFLMTCLILGNYHEQMADQIYPTELKLFFTIRKHFLETCIYQVVKLLQNFMTKVMTVFFLFWHC